MSEKKKQVPENIQAMWPTMTDQETDQLLAYTEGMRAVVSLRSQAQAGA